MCGIFCCVYEDKECRKKYIETIKQSVIQFLQRRGPDYCSTKEKTLSTAEEKSYRLQFTGTVLHLRGSLTNQPYEDEHGNVLVWNGEVFDGIKIPADGNDTSVLSHLLGNHDDKNPASHVLDVMASVRGPWAFVYWQASQEKLWFGRDFFGRRSLLWHLPSFEGDPFFISSVAARTGNDGQQNMLWEEVPAHGVYCLEPIPEELDHQNSTNFRPFKLTKFAWKQKYLKDHSYAVNIHSMLESPVAEFNSKLPSESYLTCLGENNEQRTAAQNALVSGNGIKFVCESKDLSSNLEMDAVDSGTRKDVGEGTMQGIPEISRSEEKRIIRNFPSTESTHGETVTEFSKRFGVLNEPSASEVPHIEQAENFMGSEFLTEHEFVKSNTTLAHQPDNLSLDSSQSSLEVTKSPKSLQGQHLAEELITVLGEAVRKRVFNLPRLLEHKLQGIKLDEKREDPRYRKDSDVGCSAENSGILVKDQDGLETERLKSDFGASNMKDHCRVGILFSGGIDSIVLAVLADRFVPENEAIDLINVAFEQKATKDNQSAKRKTKRNKNESFKVENVPNFDVPDRLTGRSGVTELAAINPQREWNFVEVNVTLGELKEARSEQIIHLVSPLKSVLDDSIGCALWFAARGSGVLRCPLCIGGSIDKETLCSHSTEYTSKSKVLLVGMGADEQLGGYSRHRTKFNQQGWTGLIEEIEMEVARISARNLGRDDRCISDHGREARFPFLDENVVSFLNSLPIWLKTDPRLPRGVGEKLLLRQAARLLGLTSSAALPKRAIQFGSRIAKLESASEKGSDTCTRLK